MRLLFSCVIHPFPHIELSSFGTAIFFILQCHPAKTTSNDDGG